MPTLPEIRRALAAHRARTLPTEGKRRAAVAMLLREAAESPQVLLIERARREGDPWSGHMAFPGGRIDPGDPHARGAAERETLEEVGVSLEAAEPLGRLDDMEGRHVAGVPQFVISAFVYAVEPPRLRVSDDEVREAFWFPLRALHDPTRHVDYTVRLREFGKVPAIRVGEPERQVVWGLTYRFIESFFHIVGRPLPDRWGRS